MTGPKKLCYVNCGLPADECACYRDTMSHDPAVLAALPDVQALIAAAYEVAARSAEDQERLCAEWFLRTGKHANVYEQLPEVAGRIRAITPADATAALARIERDAEARGMVKGMREAAEAAEAARQWVIHSVQRDVIAGISCGHDRAVKAILARADQIEKDAK